MSEILSAPIDAVLVHGYWLSQSEHPDNIEGYRGSLRTRLATRAAADLFHSEGPFHVVFAGGKLKGPSYPATSMLSAEEAINKYQIPEEYVHTTDTGFNTESESLAFEEMMEANSWNRIGVIAFADHSPSVYRFMPRIDSQNPDAFVKHRTVEEIIYEYDDHHVSKLIDRLNHSRYHVGFKVVEFLKILNLNLPGGEERYRSTQKLRINKDDSIVNDAISHIYDVFKS